MNKLILISPRLPHGRVELTAGDLPVSLGRSRRANITIADALLSRLHSEIREGEPGQFEIVDLDSTNLTIVNGHDVTVKVLCTGDRIYIGETEIVVEVIASPTNASEQTTRDLPLLKRPTDPGNGNSG
ncbi:MAG: FHA domain-containing protein [Planctomycetaceae bacterium]